MCIETRLRHAHVTTVPAVGSDESPHEAMCPLSDSIPSVMNLMSISSKSNIFTRNLVRWIDCPRCSRGTLRVKTMAGVDQEIGGTTPVEFERDKLAL